MENSANTLRAELPSDMVLEPGQIYEFVFENVNRDIIQQKLFIQMLREGMFYFGENEYVTKNKLCLLATSELTNHASPDWLYYQI